MSIRIAAFWSVGAQYAGFVIQFITSVIISRFFLPPAEMGLFSIALATAMLVSIFQDFGLQRFIAGAKELGDDLIRTCSSVSLIFSFVVSLLIMALAWPTSVFYDQPRLFAILMIIGAAFLATPWSIVPTALMVREMDFKSQFYMHVGSLTVNMVVALTLAVMGWGAELLAWAFVAQVFSRAIIGQHLLPVRVPFPLALKGSSPILRFGSSASVLYFSGAVATRSPDLIVGRFLGMTAVGLFSRATALASQLRFVISGAVSGVLFPAFARIRDAGEPMGPPYVKVVAGFTAVTWPAMAGLAVASQPIILMLYGPVWADTAELLFWVALGELVMVSLPMHTDMPILMGRINKLIGFNMIDTFASIIILVAASQWGLIAAAQSRVIYALIWFILYARFQQQMVGFAWAPMMIAYVKSGVATVAAMAPMMVVFHYWLNPADTNLLQLFALTGSGIACWLATLFLVRHPIADEIKDVLVAKFPRLAKASA
jgi:O-antigen/teichoic acid export membrane protein